MSFDNFSNKLGPCARKPQGRKVSRVAILFLVFALIGGQASFGQNNQTDRKPRVNPGKVNNSLTGNVKETVGKDDHIVFLMLHLRKDSLTRKDTLILMNKIIKPGSFKDKPHQDRLSRLPYLSIVFYKDEIPIDSNRQGYPLRERIQNTRENSQGYKDVEKKSMEFFIRFLQKETDKIRFFKITETEKTDLLTVDLSK